jgi:GNAT superfamily N-acetyltransferase
VTVTPMTQGDFPIRIVHAAQPHALPLADVLIDCVDGGASVSFMAPLAPQKALQFWEAAIRSAEHGERIILVAQSQDEEVLGTVQVVLNLPDNQPHRGDVCKMLVHHKARRRGVAAALMRAIESAALEAGRTLLVLDTVTGGDAERLYARLDWQKVGVIPDFALWPFGGFCSTTYFYKKLA